MNKTFWIVAFVILALLGITIIAVQNAEKVCKKIDADIEKLGCKAVCPSLATTPLLPSSNFSISYNITEP